jgi:hypothetical protein
LLHSFHFAGLRQIMEIHLKMLQLALLNRVPFGKFIRASAFPVVRLRRTGLASELQ